VEEVDIGLLILRLVVGALFIGHGTQKLFGWFGGHGLKGTGGFFESIGYRPGPFMALIAGTTETVGGLLLASGFLTPLAAAMIVGVMINAIVTVKLSQGLLNGYELDLTNLVAATAVAFAGPGAYSLDRAAGWDLSGNPWGLGALALGVVTAGLTLATRRVSRPAAIPEVQQQAA
jgi:putative oxidoreductase